ncbi:MAG TPA: dihydrofolate reductase family protein [Candidatus Saccharibacteria bacterium]|nr:dihydrofolate reductase family protein [Candidatus Saccharibacteria bacterium]
MIATLFMLMSLDGKISTGTGNDRDFDKDLPKIPGAAEGLEQYYALEQQTDFYSFNTGKVMAKVGRNEAKKNIQKIPVTFVLVDNQPHLTKQGVENLLKRCKSLIIATVDATHPALDFHDENLKVITYGHEIDLVDLFKQIESLGAERITIQSGGEMNASLLRTGLIDELSIVVCPVLIGGTETPSLIGGESIQRLEDLNKIKILELIESKQLENNYLHLRYRVKK